MHGADAEGGPPGKVLVRIQARPAIDVEAAHSEGVVWDAVRRRLLFVDIPTGRVFEHDPTSTMTTTYEIGRHVSAVQPRSNGGLLLAVREGFATLDSGGVRSLVAPYADDPTMRMNDGNCDPRGRYFAGSMAYSFEPGAAKLFRLDADGSLRTVLTGVTISNGIDWSPGGTLCYYVDSAERRVDVFDYDVAAGEISRPRPFATLEPVLGLPDGLTVDADGGVWVALFGGGEVRRFDTTGTLTAIVEVPGARLVTSCCFGGPDLSDLYISTSTEDLTKAALREQPHAGEVFVASPGWQGKPAVSFAG